MEHGHPTSDRMAFPDLQRKVRPDHTSVHRSGDRTRTDIIEHADAAAARAVAVIHAQAAALAWVHDTTGTYPAPRPVSDAIAAAAASCA